MNILTFDSNCCACSTVLRERNVSRAAERLALSQPAVSNALNRLRDLFDDLLLVRVGRTMQRDAAGPGTGGATRAALRQIEESLGEYSSYLPLINEYFEDFDIAAMVNWHGGQNAPDKVLCIHTVGDLASARYSPSNPVPSTNLARALEHHRERLNLEEFKVTTEATHWSGSIVYDGKSEWIEESKLPFLDIEIGSTSGKLQQSCGGECNSLCAGGYVCV